VAWCGPGTTSGSAVGVKLNPKSVTEGSTTQSAAEQQAFISYCEGLANTRLQLVGVVGGASIAGAAMAIWVMGIPRSN